MHLCVNLVLNSRQLAVLLVAQLLGVYDFDKVLAVFKTGADLIRQPSSNWSAASSTTVLGVVDNVLFDHDPVLVAELKGHVIIAQH